MSSTNLLRRCHKPLALQVHKGTLLAVLAASLFFSTETRAQTGGESPELLAASSAVVSPAERNAGVRRFVGANGLVRTERPEDQSIILEVRVDQTVLAGEFVFGYQRAEGDPLIGLGGLNDLLSFAINVDPETGVAEGWFLAEERTFDLSTGGATLYIEGAEIPFPQEGVELHEDDIYVSAALIQKWFPLDVTADLLRMALLVQPREKLPFQLAQERQAQAIGATISSASDIDPIEIPYQLFAAPTFNVTASGSVAKSDANTDTSGNFSVQSRGDLLGFSSSLNAFMTYRDADGLDLDTFDVLLEREDPRGGLLGPLKATNVALGDVLMPAVPLVSTVRRGRGAYISNTGNNRASQADDFVLVGVVPPGWDVELYQDDRLLGIQTVGNDGNYEFSALSLRPGANEFRIVAYGPNGEVDEKTERVFLGPGLKSAGELAYEFGAVQSSDALVSLSDQSLPDEPGFVGRLEYGVSDTFSLVAGGAFGTIGRRTGEGALFTGARASLAGYYVATDFSMEEQGSFALSNEVRTVFGGLDASVSHVQRFNPAEGETDIRSETVLGFGHRPFSVGDARIGQRAEFARQNRFNRPTAYIADHQLAVNWQRWNASHSLNVQWFSSGTVPTTVNGAFALRGRQGEVLYRVQADYSPTQDRVLQNVSLQARRRFGRDITATADIAREFNSGVTSFGLDLNWRFNKVSVGLTPSVDSKGNYVFAVTLRTALLPQDRVLKYRFAGAEERSGGAILGVRVFADMNGNETYDSGEPLLPDVVVSGTRKRSEAMTNASGVAWVPNLMPGPQTIVSLDQRTLPDVTYRPKAGHIVVQTRPGVLPIIDYPVMVFGEIDGFVTVTGEMENGEPKTKAGARVQLVDTNGVVVAQTRSEYDGYYFFSDLKLGEYSVSISTNTPGADPTFGEMVSLTAAEPFKSDVNLAVPGTGDGAVLN